MSKVSTAVIDGVEQLEVAGNGVSLVIKKDSAGFEFVFTEPARSFYGSVFHVLFARGEQEKTVWDFFERGL